MNRDSDVVTLEVLTLAIKKIKSCGEPSLLARYLLNFFGYGDEIIDNILTSHDRDVFYTLEGPILKVGREETTIKHGKTWRTNYWIWNKDEIFKPAPEEIPCKEVEFYSTLSDDAWVRSEN